MKSKKCLVIYTAATLSIAAPFTGCAHLSDSAPSGASSEGVRMTIRAFECLQIAETSDSKKGADLVIDLEIHNQSPVPLVVRTGAMQVVDSEGGSMTRRGWSQKEPVQVAPGSNRNVTMHFLGSARHCCSASLSLNPSGVTVGDRSLAVTPIKFVPACLF